MKLHCYLIKHQTCQIKNFFFFFNHIFLRKLTIYYFNYTINIPKKNITNKIIIIFPDKYNKIKKNLFYAFLTQYTVNIMYRKFRR